MKYRFAFYANVSWFDYVAWLRLSGNTGLLVSTLKQNVEWAVYLSVPLMLSYYAVPKSLRRGSPAWRNTLTALVLGVAGVVIAASKPGAGPYHLLPFVPIIIFAEFSPSATVDAAIGPACTAFVLTAVAISAAQQLQFVTTMRERRVLNESDDILQFAESHPGVVAMGYGSTESLSLERPLLTFRYNTYLLDQPAIRESQGRGEAPFSGRNGYGSVLAQPLYPGEFRRVFEQAHSIVGATRYYDI